MITLFRLIRIFPFVLSLSKDGRKKPGVLGAKPFMLRLCSARTVLRKKPFREVVFGEILTH